MSFEPRFTVTPSITKALSKIDRARGFIEGSTLSEAWLSEMKTRALILEAHHTTHIEGTQLTLVQSEKILTGIEVPGTNQDDVRELLNYREALEYVTGCVDRGQALSKEIIRRFHEHLVRGVRNNEATPGEYREIQNYIVDSVTHHAIYTPPSPEEVPPLMHDLVSWFSRPVDPHPVIAAGVAQFQLVHIHPFLDGNGRTARLLSTYLLSRSGYDFKNLSSISEFYDRDRPAYYHAIQSVREHDMDMTAWLEYFCLGLATQGLEIQDRGMRFHNLSMLSAHHSLSERQNSALDFILEMGELTIKDFERLFPETNRRTLQRDLRKMVEVGLLETSGHTNLLKYHLREQG